jgi:hypothetical protein
LAALIASTALSLQLALLAAGLGDSVLVYRLSGSFDSPFRGRLPRCLLLAGGFLALRGAMRDGRQLVNETCGCLYSIGCYAETVEMENGDGGWMMPIASFRFEPGV